MNRFLPPAALLLLVLASVSFAQTAPAASPSPASSPKPGMSRAQIRNRIIATDKRLWEAWKNKDGKPFKTNLTADAVIVGEMGVMGKNDAVTGIPNMPCEIKSYTLSDFKVTFPSGGTAIVTYKGMVDGSCQGTALPNVWASSVYVNRGGKWMVASHQETAMK